MKGFMGLMLLILVTGIANATPQPARKAPHFPAASSTSGSRPHTSLISSSSQSVAQSSQTTYYGAPYYAPSYFSGYYDTIPAAAEAAWVDYQHYWGVYPPNCGFSYEINPTGEGIGGGGIGTPGQPYVNNFAFMYERGSLCSGGPEAISGTAYSYNPRKNAGDGAGCDGGEGHSGGGGGSGSGGNGGGNESSCADAKGAPMAGDPINVSTGNMYLQEDDYPDGGWLTFRRFYNSWHEIVSASLGAHWRDSFDRSLLLTNTGTTPESGPLPPNDAMLYRPDGKAEAFTKTNGVWTSDSDVPDVLIETDDSQGAATSYTVFIAALRQFETYNTQGLLESVTDENGQGITLAYSTASTDPSIAPAPNLLLSVTDPQGRQLNFTYYSAGQLHQVTLPDGSTLIYAYDGNGNLTSVTYPDLHERQYVYNEQSLTGGSNLPNALTGIIDESDTRYESISYDSSGRATSSVFAGSVGGTHITYSSSSTSSVQYPLGASANMGFTTVNGLIRVASLDQPCGTTCNQPWKSRTYDTNGYPYSYTDFNNNVTTTIYDSEGLLTQEIDASGTSSQRTINTQWDDALRNPLDRQVLDVNGTSTAKTDWTYNARGQVLARCEYDPTTSGATGYVCSNTDTPPAGVRRWTYTYCDAVDGSQCPLVGLLLSADGPRTDASDITQYTYYLDTDESGCGTPGGACHRAGDLWKRTDALGHVTETMAYDKDGRVARSKDANGILTDLTYTPRGWLHTRTVRANADGSPSVQDATTTIDYYPVGTVKQVTQPDGVYTHYDYDDAHRLTKITDALGNYIQYTLDAAGNRTEEDTYAAGSTTPSHTLSRHFNTLGQQDKAFDAYMQATSYLYDPNGNRTDATDPKTITTHSDYDPLNRLSDTIQNYQGSDPATQNTTTGYQYDSQDNLSQVTDPDTLITHYTYDGLKDLGQLQSPDTGTSHYTYDAAGNRVTQTDAKTVLTTYGYDALNRLTSIIYPTSTLDINYYYDEPDSVTGCSGSYPIGRLTRMTDSSGSTAYCYGQRGNVVAKMSTIGTVPATTRYSYNLADRLMEVDYPGSQADVVYTRDADGRIASVSNGTTPIVTSISYLPFGPATLYSFAGGQALTKIYDANYHATDITGGNALNLHFKLDALGDISAEGDASGVPTPNESYQYDPLYRLQEVDDATGIPWQSYTYSKTGDRLSKTTVGQSPADAYSYTPGTHHLIGISGYDASSRAVNPNGNTSAFQANGWMYGLGYNDTNRLSLVQQNGVTVAAYSLDGKGERVRKLPAGATPIEYVYDEAGRLLYEYTGPSQNRAYIWADGTLVASVEDNATIHYVYTDHLGTPRALTTTTNDTPIWTWPWLQNPFGEQPASGAGGYTFNLRYPGQYYDSETGLNYNHFRDYEPATGRYIQSDPIGLTGGISTYVYVGGAPLTFSDLLGREVTTQCRPIEDPKVNWLGFVHCAVFVWHWETDDCGNRKKVVDGQYSIAGGETPQTDPTLPTYSADRNAFNNPGQVVQQYSVPPPPGFSQQSWDSAVMNAGSNYNSGQPYSAVWGPNSNTAAHDIIQNAGGVPPDISMAWQYYYSVQPPGWGYPGL